MQVHADRSFRESGTVGDFGAGHAFDEPHQQRLAIGVRQLSDRVENGQRVGFDRLAARQFVRQLDLFVRSAEVIDRAVSGDRREPSPERRRLTQPLEPRERRQKHILNEIVDVAPWHAAEQDGVHHPEVARVQLAERLAVARGGGANRGRQARRVARAEARRQDVRLWQLGQHGAKLKRLLHLGPSGG